MKQRKFITAVIATLIAGQALALDVGTSSKVSQDAVDVPHEITLQHEFVEQFKFFGDTRYFPLSKFVRDVAPSLKQGMTATIIARDDDEADLVASTYRRYGATVNFATAIDPAAKLVTIKIHQN